MKQTSKKKWKDTTASILTKILAPSQRLYLTTLQTILWELYTCEDRHYHTTYHVVWMLDKAKEMEIELTPEQELAILFHDAIYTPGAPVPKNEFASAGLMRCLLTTPLLEAREPHEKLASLESASKMVENTALHFAPPGSMMEMEEGADLILDLDLANFASPYTEFCEWGEAVMKEIPEATIEGRTKFLKSMLAREQIFVTEEFAGLEDKARENIARWINESKE